MFALHETTQRRVCRISFVTLCVLPTLATLVAIAYCNRPWRQADWQQTLAQQLHVRATLSDITRPRPGVTVLTEIRLSDLLTRESLGSIGKLNLCTQNSRRNLHADHLKLRSEQLSSLGKAISAWLATNEPSPLDLHADRLTIETDSNQPLELRDLSIRSDQTSHERQRFRVMARTGSDEILEVAVDFEPGVLRCALDTQQASLPAWLVGALVPGVAACGEAEFIGSISAESTEQRVRGKLVGSFERVDLQAWIGPDCPHRLHGTAQVEFELCTWVENRLDVVRGRISADSGACSQSLLANAKDLCACVPGAAWKDLEATSQEELVAYDELALSFDMSRAGIKFAGACQSGGVISVAGLPLLFAPPNEPKEALLPVGQLVQLLDFRRQPGWLPATRGAVEMADRLPLPEKRKRE